MADLFAALEPRYCPPLDAELVRAICSDEGQTLRSAEEVLQALAADAGRYSPMRAAIELSLADADAGADAGAADHQRASPPAETRGAPVPGAGASASAGTRKGKAGFSGKLTLPPDSDPSPPRARKAPSPGASRTSKTPSPSASRASSARTSPFLEVDSAPFWGRDSVAAVEQVLDEWAHSEAEARRRLAQANGTPAEGDVPFRRPSGTAGAKADQADLLHLTDEEDDATKASPPRTAASRSKRSSGSSDSGIAHVNGSGAGESADAQAQGLAFLEAAFPARTPAFLTQILFGDCDGSVDAALDALLAIDAAEAEEAELSPSASASASISGSGSSAARDDVGDGVPNGNGAAGGGLSDDVLLYGAENAAIKGKKRKAARRRLQDEQRRFREGLPSVGSARANGTPQLPGTPVLANGSATSASSKKNGAVKLSLTDVRHGGPIRDAPLKSVRTPTTASGVASPRAMSRSGSAELDGGGGPPTARFAETDEEFARRVAQAERERARDPDDDRPVTDNSWVLNSSILAQLSTLLDIPPDKATSAYNAANFTLPIAVNRLIHAAAEEHAPRGIESLDERFTTACGENGARQVAEGIAAVTGAPYSQAAKAYCATNARQDAAIDLVQLQATLYEATGTQPDLLDPLGKLTLNKSAVSPKLGFSVPADPAQGYFVRQYDPKPGEAAGIPSASGGGGGGGYAGAAQRGPTAAYQEAARASQRLAAAATGTVLPASSARVRTHEDDEAEAAWRHSNAGDAYRDYRLIADEYRARRMQALQHAASAWRAGGGGLAGVGGGSGGGGGRRGAGGQARGGIAWYYADEARRLDAKARAWNMRAAQALVEARRGGAITGPVSYRAADSAAALGSEAHRRDSTIDLHGLTVHEALTVTRDCVNEWYSRPSHAASGSAYIGPLHIITGVGRHSPGNVAVIKPAVIKMLDREGWRCDVDHHRGIITVRGVK